MDDQHIFLEQMYSIATFDDEDDQFSQWRLLRAEMMLSAPDRFQSALMTLHGFTMSHHEVVTAEIVQKTYPCFATYSLTTIEMLFMCLENDDRGFCEGAWGDLVYLASSLEDWITSARLIAENSK
jgi:hypothetical protein